MSDPILSNKPEENKGKFVNFGKYLTNIVFDFIKDLKIAKEKLSNFVETNYNLGIYHMKLGNLHDAAFRFKIVTKLKPDYALAYFNLGKCQFYLDKKEAALENLKKASSLAPNFPDCDYMIAKIDGKTIPTAISVEYVEEYYDEIAENYIENHITKPNYRAHSQLIDMLLPSLKSIDAPLDILDLGCGTGVCGEYLKTKELAINHITGIDISGQMIAGVHNLFDKQNNPVYSEIIKMDFREYLKNQDKNQKHKYHLILATSSLDYIRDLSAILKEAKALLNPNGIIAFTITKAIAQDVEMDSTKEHFAFSEAYIKEMCKSASLNISSFHEIMLDDFTKGLAIYTKVSNNNLP